MDDGRWTMIHHINQGEKTIKTPPFFPTTNQPTDQPTNQHSTHITQSKVMAKDSESESCDVGLWGLAIMGQNFALNMASHGFQVVVGNRSPSKVDLTVTRAKNEGSLPVIGSTSHQDFVSKLQKPRKIILLVMAGKPVDDTIAALAEHLEPGDLIVDGGNEWYPNSIRRAQELEKRGVLFMGMGISGGEEGARNGPSLMPGGKRKAYDLMEPILVKCAAQVEDGACTGYLGPIGAGNYVKMVHNGIEYGDMQLIAEVYDVLRGVVGMTNADMSRQFARWNDGDLSSYLIEITAKILAKEDDVTGTGYVLDYVSRFCSTKTRQLPTYTYNTALHCTL